MWIALAGIALHFGLSLLWPYRPSAPLFLLGVALGFGFLALAYRKLRARNLSWRWLLVTALLLRLVWFVQPPGLSEDAYRYLWDGMLSAQGVNPYPQAPQELTEIQQQHSDLYSKMTHADRTSIYPPAAQFLFWANHLLWGTSVIGWKIWLLLAELLLLCFWQRWGGLQAHNLSLWLLNPLVVIEFYSSGHIDLLAVCLLTGALVLATLPGRTRQLWQPLLLSLATLIKLFPAFAAPLLIKHQGSLRASLRYGALYALGLALPTAAFLALRGFPAASWEAFTEIVNTFRSIWRFNALPILALDDYRLTLRPLAERVFLYGLLGIVLGPSLWRLFQLLRRQEFKQWRDWLQQELQPPSLESLASSLYFILMLLYVCSHTMHPWYLSWGLLVYPILGMRYWAGIYLSAASFVSYLTYWFEPPGDRLWALWLEYLPFYLLLLRDVVWEARQRARKTGPGRAGMDRQKSQQ